MLLKTFTYVMAAVCAAGLIVTVYQSAHLLLAA